MLFHKKVSVKNLHESFTLSRRQFDTFVFEYR